MYLGRIVELADKATIFTRPGHPYTEALLSAIPVPDPAIRDNKRVLQGDVPSPLHPPPGCHFHTRCPYAIARCRIETPLLREIAPRQQVAWHLRCPRVPDAMEHGVLRRRAETVRSAAARSVTSPRLRGEVDAH